MTTNKVATEEIDTLASQQYRPLKGIWQWIAIAIPIIATLLAVNQVFDWRFFVGYMLYDYSLYYILLGLLLPLAYLWIPVKSGIKGVWARRLFRLDIGFFFVAMGIGLYFAWHGYDIIVGGWERMAPALAIIMAVIIWFLLVESVRRSFGTILGAFVFIAAIYPVFAEYMPGLLEGVGRPFVRTLQFHILGTGSAMGVLIRLYVQIVMGFTLFGVAVNATGGGKFFLNLALSILGRTRGGPAKVAVLASALFGSVSGASIINVMTTGCVTIPAMKRGGIAPHYAGAIETCASTAGTFTPPIMGESAFVMASFLAIPYPEVALAAAVPAMLFYVGLYTQIDGYSAKKHLSGLAKVEVPSLLQTLKDGWFYLPVAGVLVYYLFGLRLIGESAYVSTALMLVLAQIRKETRFTRESFLRFFESAGQTLTGLFVVLAGVGMMLGAFGITGIATTFARELLILAGGNLPLMLVLCAVASLIMGMGMTLIACYVFLAIVVAPALVQAGVAPLSAHLFILYTGMLSYITPPIALCAFPAAAIAGSSAMKVAVTAVRLGGVIYLMPFFFVLDPGLLLRGEVGDIILAISTTLLGVFLIGSAFEGYLLGIGELWPTKEGGYSRKSYLLIRGTLVASGFLLGLPWLYIKGFGLAIGAAVLLPMFLITWRERRVEPLTARKPTGHLIFLA